MRLYNTLSRSEEEFAPSDGRTVRMYTCGLTVYARGHIGNFRTFVNLDVLRRTLKYQEGYDVRQVTNFTDVDDKTIAASEAAGVSLREYTDRYIAAFHEDASAMGLERAEEYPRATDEGNLRAMTAMIEQLEARGHTYRSDGSIYFRIASLPGYGKLARLDPEGIRRGHVWIQTPMASRTPETSCCGRPPSRGNRHGTTAWVPDVLGGISSAQRWRSGCSDSRRSTSTAGVSI
jgi:cysteinyl-tRNA synthetase